MFIPIPVMFAVWLYLADYSRRTKAIIVAVALYAAFFAAAPVGATLLTALAAALVAIGLAAYWIVKLAVRAFKLAAQFAR